MKVHLTVIFQQVAAEGSSVIIPGLQLAIALDAVDLAVSVLSVALFVCYLVGVLDLIQESWILEENDISLR